jgi:predicted transcriptional regulator
MTERRGPNARDPIHGELQAQIMGVLWRLERGTVEEVRRALPPRYRSAYNTIQTVLNRLVGRGLLSRERHGSPYVYSPRVSEAEQLQQSIAGTLAMASGQARQVVLANLVGDLDASSRPTTARRRRGR